MNHQRPINLDLTKLKFPPMAIASILHRISGLILFLFLPVILYTLKLSLQSTSSFDELDVLLTHPTIKLCLWLFSSALVYHALAGIRHIILDFGVGESVIAARRSALVMIVLSIVIIIFLGIRIW